MSSLVGTFFESKRGTHWYHSSDLFPSKFVNKGTIVEVIEELPNHVRLKFESEGDIVKITKRELKDNFKAV